MRSSLNKGDTVVSHTLSHALGIQHGTNTNFSFRNTHSPLWKTENLQVNKLFHIGCYRSIMSELGPEAQQGFGHVPGK